MNQNVKIIGLFLVLSYFAKIVMVPIFLALFLAMLIEPAVGVMAARGFTRTGAAVLVILLMGCGFAFAGWLAYMASLEMIAALPVYAAKINSALERLNAFTDSLYPPHARGTLPSLKISGPSIQWSHLVFTSLGTIYEVISILVFVPLLMFYFLIDKGNLLESFNIINGRYFNLPKLNFELPRMLRVFFAANLVTGLFLVVVQGVIFVGAGYDNWVSLALVTGFLNLLPVVGAPLAVVAAVILGVGLKFSLALAIGISAAIFALHFLANNLIVPLLVGARLNINAITLIIGLLFWSWMWGAAGFFLAVPMTALIKILLECNRETYAFANLMAAKPRHVLSGRAVSPSLPI